MSTTLDRPATRDGLFLWVMHRFAEVFEAQAVIKGGMVFRLLDSPRHTTDIDYVFVPFSSKKEIAGRIADLLDEIEGAAVAIELHSRMLRADLRVDDASIQIEANVAAECDSIAMATGGFARTLGRPSRVVRVMSPSHALAHKIAAWNERRLLRDLYDCYFLSGRAKAEPDLDVLDSRLARIESRLPGLKRTRSMSRDQLIDALRRATARLSDSDLEAELAGLLPAPELAGLAIRIAVSIEGLITLLRRTRAGAG